MTAEAEPQHYRTRRAVQKAAKIARRVEVARMLLEGMEQREIAAQLGVSLGCVSSDVAAIKAEWRKKYADTYETLRAKEYAKLDRLERAWAARAYTADAKATDFMLRINSQRAKLMTSDLAMRVEHTGAEGGPIEIVGLDELAAQAEADVLFLADHRKDTGTG